jgi:hypothetical protein
VRNCIVLRAPIALVSRAQAERVRVVGYREPRDGKAGMVESSICSSPVGINRKGRECANPVPNTEKTGQEIRGDDCRATGVGRERPDVKQIQTESVIPHQRLLLPTRRPSSSTIGRTHPQGAMVVSLKLACSDTLRATSRVGTSTMSIGQHGRGVNRLPNLTPYWSAPLRVDRWRT